VSESEQAAALRAAYCDVNGMNDVPVMLVFRLRDTAGASWLDQLGVTHGNGQFKPAATELRDVVAHPSCGPTQSLRITASTTRPERGQVVRFQALGYSGPGSYAWDLRGTGNYQTYTTTSPRCRSRGARPASGRSSSRSATTSSATRRGSPSNVTGHRAPVPRLRILLGKKGLRAAQPVRTRQQIVLNGQSSFARLSTSRVRNWQWYIELEDHRFHHYSGAVLGYRYRRPGRYRIRLVVTDTFGVKGRASRVLQVTGRDFRPAQSAAPRRHQPQVAQTPGTASSRRRRVILGETGRDGRPAPFVEPRGRKPSACAFPGSADRRPALVVAVLALVVALGGTAYAVKQINGSTIKQRSIPGDRIRNNALTGTQINEARLGRVNEARNATNSKFALRSSAADSAANALNAGNASALAGNPPSAFQGRIRWAVVSAAGTVLDQSRRHCLAGSPTAAAPT